MTYTIEATELCSYHSSLNAEQAKVQIIAKFRIVHEEGSFDISSQVVLDTPQMPSIEEQIELVWRAFIPPVLRVAPLLDKVKPVAAKNMRHTHGSKPFYEIA